jgi:hypothetical protein
MNSLATLEFANATIADAERHWLYGHPYRKEQRPRSYAGTRTAKRTRPRFAFAARRRSAALAARRDLAA